MNASCTIPDGHLAYKDAVFISPHKFIGGPGTPGVLVAKRSVLRNRFHRSRAAERSCTSAHPGTPITRTRDPRGGRHAGDRRVDPRRAGVRAQGAGRRGGDPPPRARPRSPRACLMARQPADRDPRQHRARTPRDRLLRRPPRRPACCTRTSSRRCSATCSASRPAAAASAPARISIGCMGSTTRWSDADGVQRSGKGQHGRDARVHAGHLQLLHQRDRCSTTSSMRSTSSPTMDGSCCRCTASIPRPVCGATAPPASDCTAEPARCVHRMTPLPPVTAPESVLAGQLAAARQIIADVECASTRRAPSPISSSPAGIRVHSLVPSLRRGAEATAEPTRKQLTWSTRTRRARPLD